MDAFFIVMAVACIPVLFTLLSGYYLHRARHSSGTDSEKRFRYVRAYLVFFVPNLVLFLIPSFHANLAPLILGFYAIVTVLLFLFLPYTTPEKPWPMYVPGILLAGCALVFAGSLGVEGQRRETQRIERKNKDQERYDSVMKALAEPKWRMRPELSLTADDFQWIDLGIGEYPLSVPIPVNYMYDPVPEQNDHDSSTILRFSNPQTGGEIIAVVKPQSSKWKFLTRSDAATPPFLDGSAFEHFADVPAMYFWAEALFNDFRENKEKQPIYFSGFDLEIPADTDDLRIRRVVQYDDVLVASRFPCVLIAEKQRDPATGERIRHRLSFLFAAGLTKNFALECLVFSNRDDPAADSDMLLSWMNALFKNSRATTSEETDAAAPGETSGSVEEHGES